METKNLILRKKDILLSISVLVLLILGAISVTAALQVSLVTPANNTAVQTNYFNLSFNVTGTADYYKCVPYIEIPSFVAGEEGKFIPMPPMPGDMSAELTEDPMAQLVKYKNNTGNGGYYNITMWQPNGNFTWNVRCEAVTTVTLILNTTWGGPPRLTDISGNEVKNVNLEMGDFIRINSPIDNKSYTINITEFGMWGQESIVYNLANSSYNITTHNGPGTESYFVEPNNFSLMDTMIQLAPGMGEMSSPPPARIYIFNASGDLVIPYQFVNVTVNPIMAPPDMTFNATTGKAEFENFEPPMPKVYIAGSFASVNRTVIVNGSFEPMFNFEEQICKGGSPPPFCNEIGNFNNDGFFFETFEDCINGLDDDQDNYIDEQDADCFWLPNYNTSTADNPTPTILRTKTFSFSGRLMFDFETDITTNATLTVYNTGQIKQGSTNSDEYTCTNVNQTVKELGIPGIEGSNFFPFHHLEVKNLGTATGNLYYEIQVCSKRGKCSQAYCKQITLSTDNFETKSFDFSFTPPDTSVFGGGIPFAGTPDMQFVHADGTTEDVSSGALTNRSNITFRFAPPSTDGWRIDFGGADFTGNYTLDLGSAFTQKLDSSGKKIIGMNHTKWLDIVQNLNLDYLDLTLPEQGSSLTKCDEDGNNCNDITSSVTKISSTEDATVWRIPVTLGFSTYTTSGDVTLSIPYREYEVYGSGAVVNITMNSSGIGTDDYNITFFNSTTNGGTVNSIKEWNGSDFVTFNVTHKILDASSTEIYQVNISLASYNSTIASLTWQIVNASNGTSPTPSNYTINIYGATIKTNRTTPTGDSTPQINITIYSSYDASPNCQIVNASDTTKAFGSNFTASNNTIIPNSTTTLPDGTHNYIIKCNNSNNDTYLGGQKNIVIDSTTAPTINSVSISKTVIRTSSQINVTVNATDSIGVSTVTVNDVSLTRDGTSTDTWSKVISIASSPLTVVATDDNSNSATNNTVTITFDNTAPTTTFVNSSDVDSSVWYSKNLSLSLTAADTGGANVSAIMYRNGTSGDWSVIETGLLTANLTFGANLTANIFQYRSNDTAGNIEGYQSRVIKIDAIAPD
ncbi:MAG: hypothetical protein U9O94_11400, partial [Nanoarchaeota archaeon]|nr:hypothetical protein [Nanoarchaeota archaeon]